MIFFAHTDEAGEEFGESEEEENDIEEAMLDELDDGDVDEDMDDELDDGEATESETVPAPAADTDDERGEDESEDDLFEEDVEDVDYDSFDDHDPL